MQVEQHEALIDPVFETLPKRDKETVIVPGMCEDCACTVKNTATRVLSGEEGERLPLRADQLVAATAGQIVVEMLVAA